VAGRKRLCAVQSAYLDQSKASSALDDERLRNGEVERLSALEIDGKVQLSRLSIATTRPVSLRTRGRIERRMTHSFKPNCEAGFEVFAGTFRRDQRVFMGGSTPIPGHTRRQNSRLQLQAVG